MLQETCLIKRFCLWIPSHVGINGNDIADELAKDTRLHSQNKILSAHMLANKIKTKTRNTPYNKKMPEISKLWEINSKKPRQEAVANFLLNTGHDCLCKIGIYNREEFTLCNLPGSSMGKEHLQCPNLNKIQQSKKENGLNDSKCSYWKPTNMLRVGIISINGSLFFTTECGTLDRHCNV